MKILRGNGLFAVLLTAVLAGCGGGDNGGTAFLGSGSTTDSSCPAGVSVCSGAITGNPVGPIRLTSNGLQTIAASTSDLASSNVSATEAFGLLPTTQGFADIRVLRDADANVRAVDLLLSDLKLFWDSKSERPTIIENFGITRGRVQLGKARLETAEWRRLAIQARQVELAKATEAMKPEAKP
jgi:hypothetical protein